MQKNLAARIEADADIGTENLRFARPDNASTNIRIADSDGRSST